MRCTVPAAALVLALAGCTGLDTPAATPAPDLCPGGGPAQDCLDTLQLELSRVLARAADGGPADHDHLEQAFTEVVRQERIGLPHSFTRLSEVQDRDLDAPPPSTPVEFRLGAGGRQRTYWACLPTTVVLTPGPCPPAS
jgi:hypothetical protein